MVDIAAARAAVKARIDGAGFTDFVVRYEGDREPLPDAPAAFAYVTLENDGSGDGPIAYGGGASGNLYRNRARVVAYVFSPIEEGPAVVEGYAEQIASRLRSFRDNTIMCRNADVTFAGPGTSLSPPGIGSAVNNYQCAIVEVSMTFDQIG
jgi:hypothetical protein